MPLLRTSCQLQCIQQTGQARECRKGLVDGCRATADSDEGVPLGGLAKLGSNVADLMTSLDTSRLQRPSADMNRARAVLGGNADQLLTPPSTNAKSSAESPLAGSSETTASPADVRLSMSPKRRGGSPLQKGTSLAALMDIAESEESHTSSTARLLQAGAATASPKTDDRCFTHLLYLPAATVAPSASCFWLWNSVAP